MGKDTNFIGQPILGQLLSFLDKGKNKESLQGVEGRQICKAI